MLFYVCMLQKHTPYQYSLVVRHNWISCSLIIMKTLKTMKFLVYDEYTCRARTWCMGFVNSYISGTNGMWHLSAFSDENNVFNYCIRVFLLLRNRKRTCILFSNFLYLWFRWNIIRYCFIEMFFVCWWIYIFF